MMIKTVRKLSTCHFSGMLMRMSQKKTGKNCLIKALTVILKDFNFCAW